jgi:SAM-dependent methyltransferase
MADLAASYAFPHTGADERRRLDLFEERLDPVTIRRIGLLGLAPGARCLEIGGGRGSMARWLCEYVGPKGRVTATDLDTGFLSELSLPNLDVLRHDVTTDEFPEASFELVHVRAVLMHIADRMATLRRIASWLAPGGWLLVEEPDFGMWLGDFDPVWAAHPRAWHEAFPHGSLSPRQGDPPADSPAGAGGHRR